MSNRPDTRHVSSDGLAVVGIDVGGTRKGFHAVVLVGGRYAGKMSTTEVVELVKWCREQQKARMIAVDAPCCWSEDGHARPAESELMDCGIWCFASPTRERAICHPTNYYGWMLNGESLFRALRKTHPLCKSQPNAGQKCCFETFPHAIAWHLTSGNAKASKKKTQRPELLKTAGIDVGELTSIDFVDAALCALAAHHAAIGAPLVSYGEPASGLIIVPAGYKS